ncbi:pyridoxal phosphate-dependent aminotransferase [Mesorhizobium sp. B3-1-3]|uniref:pyridoxal phosphate-dependent aminotransferase n=1 Tax=unclassified Mesorhizobium TaxID=325217 RepID=UPI00112D8471|nr:MULTISPECIES: pyridoxal phosphate-dependent aminotransferase [unclassified Mesorhizobium]TPI61482.1 pyridoxal phosphate-dependent aminotransferase [Mesorhizobium sp. B3-1-8]TPI70567.1 pyridoxal phosphate-dependent aminotransferase [Mesorhizobium sp. B3-1-3]
MSVTVVPGEMPEYRSKTLQKIGVSEILRIGARAQEMRRSGHDVIILGAGEPDFDTPDHVKEAVTRALKDGQTKYTALEGTLELREAISAKLERENGLVYRPSEIIVCCGAKQVIFNALAATLEPGDEVVIPTPFWTSYEDMVTINRGQPKLVPCGEDRHFKLDAAALEAALTNKTRWVMLNSPSNPTGAAYTAGELSSLLEVLRRHPRVLVMSDEIYEHIVYDGFSHVSPARLAPDLRSRFLIVNGVSKAYAMTGFRIGWGSGPAELIAAMAVVQSQVTSSASSIGQASALAALNGPQEVVGQRAEAFGRRRDYLISSLTRIPGISCEAPKGAFYLFPSVKGIIGSRGPSGRPLLEDRDVTEYLLERAHVALVPGSAFALPGHMRLSYAASQASLTAAVARIAEAVSLLDFRRVASA